MPGRGKRGAGRAGGGRGRAPSSGRSRAEPEGRSAARGGDLAAAPPSRAPGAALSGPPCLAPEPARGRGLPAPGPPCRAARGLRRAGDGGGGAEEEESEGRDGRGPRGGGAAEERSPRVAGRTGRGSSRRPREGRGGRGRWLGSTVVGRPAGMSLASPSTPPLKHPRVRDPRSPSWGDAGRGPQGGERGVRPECAQVPARAHGGCSLPASAPLLCVFLEVQKNETTAQTRPNSPLCIGTLRPKKAVLHRPKLFSLGMARRGPRDSPKLPGFRSRLRGGVPFWVPGLRRDLGVLSGQDSGTRPPKAWDVTVPWARGLGGWHLPRGSSASAWPFWAARCRPPGLMVRGGVFGLIPPSAGRWPC